uniref:Uncharacterized protein n=1 Tax=Mycolicibacterium sp. CBMA 213 TaxID=1968788 RepID=A0A1S6GKJ7_9MYCO|nr:hypothetical protein pCBMA213_2_00027 [Mycolicibacterium sp. CBMA 213]
MGLFRSRCPGPDVNEAQNLVVQLVRAIPGMHAIGTPIRCTSNGAGV